MSAKASIQEAVGATPNVAILKNVRLIDGDEHSTITAHLLLPNSDGTAAYSTERWLNLHFEPPFGTISNLRVWSDNLDLSADWGLNYGVTSAYAKPNSGRSQIAFHNVLTADPGEDASNILLPQDGLYGPGPADSPWLVLQAVFTGTQTPSTMQSTPLHLQFAWREC